jgi:hypothetical protein
MHASSRLEPPPVPFVHRVNRHLLRPVECADLRRLGSRNDGGYVVPLEAIREASTLLSFGLGSNWSFERAAAATNPRLAIHAYDPTVGARRFLQSGIRSALSVPLRFFAFSPSGARASLKKLRISADYFRFFRGRVRHHRRRVWYNRDRGSAAISDILAETGPHTRLSIFAKIDIEGSEYRVLPAIIDAADRFTGLVIEFHDTDICADVFNRQVCALRESFELVHAHGNNFGDRSVDHALPLTWELTFLNRSLCTEPSRPFAGTLPRPGLDMPNDPNRADFVFAF